jgi:hypothetical protein
MPKVAIMSESLPNHLSLKEQAIFIMEKGTFIEAEDYYSYRILHYQFNNQIAELTLDFSDEVVSVEFVSDENANSDTE